MYIYTLYLCCMFLVGKNVFIIIIYIVYKENNNMHKAELINNFLKSRIEKMIW